MPSPEAQEKDLFNDPTVRSWMDTTVANIDDMLLNEAFNKLGAKTDSPECISNLTETLQSPEADFFQKMKILWVMPWNIDALHAECMVAVY